MEAVFKAQFVVAVEAGDLTIVRQLMDGDRLLTNDGIIDSVSCSIVSAT